MTILTQVLKQPITLFFKFITSLILKNGPLFSYMTVLKKKHFNMKSQTAPTQSFSEHASFFNYRISMDTKGPINPPSQHKSYIHVIVDAFSHFVVTVTIKSNNAKIRS